MIRHRLVAATRSGKTNGLQKRWLAALMMCALCGCSGRSYDNKVAENFINSCRANGSSQSYCSCALDTVQAQYSQDEFAAIDAEMTSTRRIPEQFAKTLSGISVQCKQ